MIIDSEKINNNKYAYFLAYCNKTLITILNVYIPIKRNPKIDPAVVYDIRFNDTNNKNHENAYITLFEMAIEFFKENSINIVEISKTNITYNFLNDYVRNTYNVIDYDPNNSIRFLINDDIKNERINLYQYKTPTLAKAIRWNGYNIDKFYDILGKDNCKVKNNGSLMVYLLANNKYAVGRKHFDEVKIGEYIVFLHDYSFGFIKSEKEFNRIYNPEEARRKTTKPEK